MIGILLIMPELILYSEGCSLNKLQNCVILLVFKIWKIRNMHFVQNSVDDIHWNFSEGDIIIMTSLIQLQYCARRFLSQLAKC